MKYRFGKPALTCVNIETELGLARGEVKELTILADGTVELNVSRDLTATQKTRLQTLLGMAEKVI